MRSADTSRDSHERQLAIYRAMSPEQRIEIAVSMSEDALQIAAAGIRARHRHYDDDQVLWALRRLRLGDALFQRVWPDAPLLAP